jgi:hypothetical protein
MYGLLVECLENKYDGLLKYIGNKCDITILIHENFSSRAAEEVFLTAQ